MKKCEECSIDVYCEKCLREVRSPEKGDYVLATKFTDGDTRDPWAVGFYDGKTINGRHLVVDSDGNQFRLNGYARVSKIKGKAGEWLVRNASTLESYCGPGMLKLWGMMSDECFVDPPGAERRKSTGAAGGDSMEGRE